MRKLHVEVEMLDYWHCGNGEGEGSLIDAVIDRDDDGLPYLPGKTLKGLLREAAELLCDVVAADHVNVVELFGPRLMGDASRHAFAFGQLRISDARLPADVATWLCIPRNHAALDELTRVISSTAIEDATGAAKKNSLRSIEVAVPMTLIATISGPCVDGWEESIRRLVGLVQSVGANRSRGLGRCEVRVLEDSHA